MMRYYLAYGSNLHPMRLWERIHSAEFVASTSLQGYRLMWHKRGQDGSGKCNLHYTGHDADCALVAVFRIARHHEVDLDRFEGSGQGYRNSSIEIELNGSDLECFTYFAEAAYIDDQLQPFAWYKQLVLQGAHYHRFPSSYLADIEAVPDQQDLDTERHIRHVQLVERLLSANSK
jgi:gamma-glutamylcyclotransferase